MKLFINRAVVNGPWGGGNAFVKAMFELAPKLGIYVGSHLNQRYDAALLMDPRPDENTGIGIDEVMQFKLLQPKLKIIQRVNECDARKQTTGVDKMLIDCGAKNDHTIFVSDWMRSYFEKRSWPCASNTVIYNGVDSKIFKPNQKFENGKVNIVTSHWSDNKFKGYDVHQWLDEFVGKHPDDFTYTFIGRHQNVFKNTKHIEPLHGAELGNELGKYDVFVTGTRADPGPNHCLESISCGVPTYAHFEGGGAVEFVDENHVFKSPEELEVVLMTHMFNKNVLIPTSWEACVVAYCNKIAEVCGL